MPQLKEMINITDELTFQKLLNSCIQSVKKYRDNTKYPQYALYNDRYDRIIKFAEDIKSAAINKTLIKDFYSLEIAKMIEQNDPEDIVQSILAANQHYCQRYRQI